VSKVKYPAIPSGPDDVNDFRKMRMVLDPMRERLLAYGRDDPRNVRRSMITVQDLLDLGIITRADLGKLK
jgi:hypothetical protein